ncbi:MAG: hypothetical protein KY463_05030 [Actinobacteria bacterium]|nr:hypothetical protein [Actinomycetota bacterium]
MLVKTNSKCSNLALSMAVVSALALPGVAQAETTASISAAAKASARAELHVERAGRLAGDTSAAAQARATALLSRSRGEIRTAVATTRTLVAKARTTSEVSAAAQVAAQVSSTLLRDAELQSKLAIEADGRLESQAAKSLVSDVRVQRAIVTAVLRLAAKHADERAKVALQAGGDAVNALSGQVKFAAETAASADLGVGSQASADMAVAIGTDALSKSVKTVVAIEAGAQGTVQDAAQDVRQGVANATGRIAAVVNGTLIDAHRVTLGGHGTITLGALVKLSVQASASASGSTGHGGVQAEASARASGASGGLAGILGIR